MLAHCSTFVCDRKSDPTERTIEYIKEFFNTSGKIS